MALSVIAFATDAELERYESEILGLSEDCAVPLVSVRDAVTAELVVEATAAGVDPALVIDDGTDAAAALRLWATRMALRIFFEDLETGREQTESAGKAERAARHEARAREALLAIGWPVDEDDSGTIDDDEGELEPVFIRACR